MATVSSFEALCSSTSVNSSPPRRATKPRPVTRLEAPRDFAQHQVADFVTERVVHLLEAAQIQHQQRDAAFALRARQGDLEVIHQRRAVRQVRERIVRRLVLQALFLHLARGDVAHDHRAQRFALDVDAG